MHVDLTPLRPSRIASIKARIARTIQAAQPLEGEPEYSPEEIAQALSSYLQEHCDAFAVPVGIIRIRGTING